MRAVISVFIFVGFVSCGDPGRGHARKDADNSSLRAEKLIHTNQQLLAQENAEIEEYITLKKLVMKRTGTGLRYSIDSLGNGIHPKTNQYVSVFYKVSLLNGEVCYSSDGKSEIFRVDHDHVESGLHEGIKLMRVGDKAKFILPSHLAHGLTGDQNKIPPNAAIIYDIELLSLSD
jgi:FKBP-type peptidyl-prolyl cis-trans isomerase FkpA